MAEALLALACSMAIHGARSLFLASGVASCASIFLIAACANENEDASLRGNAATTESTAAAALSFASGDNDGYCASNPSVDCGEGTPLGAKQLVLTFDDGPGSQTLALSSYLKSKGIRATFFVNGHCFGSSASQFSQCQQNTTATPSDLLSQVIADGHLVGNHTQDHLDLTTLDDNTILAELTETDAIIAPLISSGPMLFRAPYGAWSAHDYDVLHASAMNKYVGPVKWDIGGAMSSTYAADWDCWQNTEGFGVMTTQQCGDRYLREIADVGRGIILMHDADYGDVTNHNLTSGEGNSIDMVKYVLDGNAALGVTGLIAQGYTFRRSDEVPAIASAISSGGGGGGGDAGAPPSDAGTDGGTCAFNPTWAQTSYANEWWIEYTISGNVTSASLEVIGGNGNGNGNGNGTTALTNSFDKWVGSPTSQIVSGTQVIVHATNAAGQSAQTQPFGYLVTTDPTTACGGGTTCVPSCTNRTCGDDSCGGSCGTCASGKSCTTAGSCASVVSDAGSDAGCTSGFSATWAEGDGADNWWVEYTISNTSTTIASAYLEVVAGGAKVTLSLDEWNKWVGPTDTSIAAGESVVVHATNTLGQSTQTSPFGYLNVTTPQTAPCTN